MKPHAVCIPFPAQGHIKPMLTLAKILHQKGFHITFVNTEFNHQRLLRTRGPNSLNGLPSFQFETIPDGLAPSDPDATQSVASLFESSTSKCLAPFKDLLAKLNDTVSSDVPPVSCIVSDLIMSFTLEAAQELSIPDVLFWTASACGYLAYAHYVTLIERGYIPLKGTSLPLMHRSNLLNSLPILDRIFHLRHDACYLTNGYLDTVIDDIPSMEGIRLRDIPSFIRTTDPDDIMINFVLRETERAKKASAVIFNTFECLEAEALNVLSSMLPPIYTIGPLHLVEKHVGHKVLDVLGSNLWKEEQECLEWLDSQITNSVVYVNFGSITVMTPDQLIEFSWGLANSNISFLWIIRPDLVSGENAVLPPEFLEATKGRGCLANWCPQEKVLSHPSVGGFLTHSGWNSTLESMCSGVPMICWPFFAEQQTNCWFCCTKWGIGMELDNDVKRDKVEDLVRELMTGDKGQEITKRAMEWKKLTEESAHSSSFKNLEKVIHEVLLPPPQVWDPRDST